jgi:hypothetical protein
MARILLFLADAPEFLTNLRGSISLPARVVNTRSVSSQADAMARR